VNAYEIPPWLTERLTEQRAERGKGYALSIRQGFMEVPDWAYHLRSADGRNLIENEVDLQRFFDLAFEAAQGGEQFGVRLLQGGRAQHFILLTGKLVQTLLEKANLAGRYAWKPDQDA